MQPIVRALYRTCGWVMPSAVLLLHIAFWRAAPIATSLAVCSFAPPYRLLALRPPFFRGERFWRARLVVSGVNPICDREHQAKFLHLCRLI